MTEDAPETTDPYGYLVTYASLYHGMPNLFQASVLVRIDPIDWFARRRMEIKHLTEAALPPSPFPFPPPMYHPADAVDYGELVLLQSWPLTKGKYHRLLAAGVFEEPTHP